MKRNQKGIEGCEKSWFFPKLTATFVVFSSLLLVIANKQSSTTHGKRHISSPRAVDSISIYDQSPSRAENDKSTRSFLRSRSLSHENHTSLYGINPAFTLHFYPSNTTFASAFSQESLQRLTQTLQNAFHDCLLPDTNSITDQSHKSSILSNAYISILILYSSQNLNFLDSDTQESQTIELHQTGDSLAVTFSSVITLQAELARNKVADFDHFTSTESLQDWLITSFDESQRTSNVIDQLHETGLSQFRWLDSMDISHPPSEDVATRSVPARNTNTLSEPPSTAVIVGASVGCIVAGAICAYFLLFGTEHLCFMKKKEEPTGTKSTTASISKNRINSTPSEKKSENSIDERSKHSDGSNLTLSDLASQSSLGSASNPKKYDPSRPSSRRKTSSNHSHHSGSRHSDSARHDSNRSHRKKSDLNSRHRRRNPDKRDVSDHYEEYRRYHHTNGSRSSSSHSGQKKRRKKKSARPAESYSMSSVSSGSLMTISEDDKNPFSSDDDEWKRLHKIQLELKMNSIPNEIVYTKSSSESENDQKKKKNPANIDASDGLISSLLTKQSLAQLPYTKSGQYYRGDGRENEQMDKSDTESISTLGASQYGYDTDVQTKEKPEKRDKNKQKTSHSRKMHEKQNKQTSDPEIPPHPRAIHNTNDESFLSETSLKQLNLNLNVNGAKTATKIHTEDNNDTEMQTLRPHRSLPNSPRYRGGHEVTIVAPKGKLGVFIIVLKKGEPCVVHSVKEDSAVYGKIMVGDIFLKIDSMDVTK